MIRARRLVDPRAILSSSRAYRAFKALISSGRARTVYVSEHVRARPGDRILDIGCGTGDVLAYLPPVDYVGFDANPRYIRAAIERFGARGRFACSDVADYAGDLARSCDLVMANGVLHHLDDREAARLLDLAARALKPGGRLTTFDGCFTTGQGHVSRWLVSLDRGRHVRRDHEYVALARQRFARVTSRVYHDLLRVPYAHIVMEATRSETA